MFRSDTYRVLIASPSDLHEEREAATQAVNEWNAQHAAAESIVLLPVRWETQAAPQTGIRPQEAINRQLVNKCDILVGMFWTRIGSSTGVADSGTVEEIAKFVEAEKPVLLYFSSRPIDPNRIDQSDYGKLKDFKATIYNKALTGNFSEIDELRQKLLRDLMSQVRELRKKTPRRSTQIGRLNQAHEITDLIVKQKQNRISPEEYQKYRYEFLGAKRRSSVAISDPVQPGEIGPNGHRVGYTKDGDKVEWNPDRDNPGKELPSLLRRGDKTILAAYNEFWEKVWWNRKQDWLSRIETGEEPLSEINKVLSKEVEKECRDIERKYGRKNLEWDDFEWGELTGRLSALAWVMGSDWESSEDT